MEYACREAAEEIPPINVLLNVIQYWIHWLREYPQDTFLSERVKDNDTGACIVDTMGGIAQLTEYISLAIWDPGFYISPEPEDKKRGCMVHMSQRPHKSPVQSGMSRVWVLVVHVLAVLCCASGDDWELKQI